MSRELPAKQVTDWVVRWEPGGFEYCMDALETVPLLLQATLTAVAGSRRSYNCSSVPALANGTLAIPGLSDFQMTKHEAAPESPVLDCSCRALPYLRQVERGRILAQ